MAVELYYDKKTLDGIIAHMGGVKDELYEEAKKVGKEASTRLTAARASTHWYKIYPDESPPHETKIVVEKGIDPEHNEDSFVIMEGLNPMSIEFGHAPSGVFGKTGSLGHIHTKAPHGLYILTLSAGLSGLNFVPAGTTSGHSDPGRPRKGKR